MLKKVSNFVASQIQDELDQVLNHQALTQEFIGGVIAGVQKHAIITGAPGLGKSFSVQQALDDAGKVVNKDYFIVKGHITPTQLFKILYLYKEAGQVVVLDDCDDVFNTEVGLNILKAAMDPTNKTVSYFSQRYMVINDRVVQDFVFDGTIILCTNITLSTGRLGRKSEHMAAITSRAPIWPMNWNSRTQKFAQIFNMVKNVGYLAYDERTNLSPDQIDELLNFLWENLEDINCLDLRLPYRIASQMKASKNWRQVCAILLRG